LRIIGKVIHHVVVRAHEGNETRAYEHDDEEQGDDGSRMRQCYAKKPFHTCPSAIDRVASRHIALTG